MSVKIDVVIPLFNKKDSIHRCLSSVINQREAVTKIVVVNDGSSDGSEVEAKKILENASQDFEILSKENGGVSYARNLGVKACSSEYVAFLDADDEWDKDFIKAQKCLIAEYNEASLFACGQKICEGEESYYTMPLSISRNLKKGYVSDFFSLSQSGRVVHSSAAVVRKSTFEELGGFPCGVKVGEDLFLWINFALTQKVAYDPRCFVTLHKDWDPVRISRNKEVPYPLVYFSQNKKLLSVNPSLKEYIANLGFLHVGGSKLEGDWRASFERAVFVWKLSKRWGILAFALSFMPKRVLFFARSSRRKRNN